MRWHMRAAAAGSLLLLIVASSCTRRTSPSAEGIWAWNGRWESAPDFVVRESGPQWAARAVVVRFCPGGRFRMATGMFYRTPASVNLGSDDGLSIYEGRWSQNGEDVTIRYHLNDVEIRFNGVEDVMKQVIVDHPVIRDDTMLLSYHQPGANRVWPFRLIRGRAMPAPLAARFVECYANTIGGGS